MPFSLDFDEQNLFVLLASQCFYSGEITHFYLKVDNHHLHLFPHINLFPGISLEISFVSSSLKTCVDSSHPHSTRNPQNQSRKQQERNITLTWSDKAEYLLLWKELTGWKKNFNKIKWVWMLLRRNMYLSQHL